VTDEGVQVHRTNRQILELFDTVINTIESTNREKRPVEKLDPKDFFKGMNMKRNSTN
jgi:hypothetical protein